MYSKYFLICISLVFGCVTLVAQSTTPTKVIVIGIDGLTVDGIEQASTPNMDKMMQEGSFTLNAQAVMPTKSSPNWMSMLSGVGPDQHRITKNGFDKDVYRNNPTCPQYSEYFPTIFTLLKEQNPIAKTALIYQWRGFKKLINPNDIGYLKNKMIRAESVARKGLKYYQEQQPTLLFLHFNLVDFKGHLKGYKHPKYYKTVERMDEMLKAFLDLADQDPNLCILLVSDHGGIDKNHGGDTPEELTVPLMAYGQNIPTQKIKKAVSNMDVGPSIAKLLQLKTHKCWEGQSIFK